MKGAQHLCHLLMTLYYKQRSAADRQPGGPACSRCRLHDATVSADVPYQLHTEEELSRASKSHGAMSIYEESLSSFVSKLTYGR